MSAPTHELPPSATNQPGFYLWVGLSNDDSTGASTPAVESAQIIEIAEALGELARELLPTAQTHTTLALGDHEQTVSPRTSATRAPAASSSRGQQSPRPQSQYQQGHGAQRYRAPYTPRRTTPTGSSAVPRTSAARNYTTDADYLNEPVDFTRNTSLPNFDFVLNPRVVIDLHNRRVIADSELQRLTYKEFELLAYLVNSAGRIISREELFNSIWRTGVQTDSRTIDVHIRRLREKLGLENHIITVRGSGYKFELTEQIDVIPAAPRSLRR